jgi:hypothetical protein
MHYKTTEFKITFIYFFALKKRLFNSKSHYIQLLHRQEKKLKPTFRTEDCSDITLSGTDEDQDHKTSLSDSKDFGNSEFGSEDVDFHSHLFS